MGKTPDNDVAAELRDAVRDNELREAKAARTFRLIVLAALLALLGLVLLWNTGRMDTFLVDFGLNRNDCFKSVSGSTRCGDDATAAEHQMQRVTEGFASYQAAVAADIRASVAAMEAYHGRHGTYRGATTARLRRDFDSRIPERLRVHTPSADTYCIEYEGSSFVGPNGKVVQGPC